MATVQQERQQFVTHWLRTSSVILLLCWFHTSLAYGDVYVMNSSLVGDACMRSCETNQTDPILIGDCQRGCRLFDALFIQDSISVQFDETIALPNCQRSCSEAYGSDTNAVMTCFDGCTYAQQEYHRRSVLLLKSIEELRRNLSFMDWFPKRFGKSNNISLPLVLRSSKNGRFDEVKDATIPDLNTNKAQSDVDNGSSINEQPIVGDDRKWRTIKQPIILPEWMIQSSVVIFVLGIFMVVGASCYCCIFGQRHLNKYTSNRTKSIDSDLPPSYEHLMRNIV